MRTGQRLARGHPRRGNHNRVSVDLETDNKIQRMIQTQFKDICIAHRLRTIISYHRILVGACTVLDAGKIAEFDTPLNLFNRNENLFLSLCDKSNVTILLIDDHVGDTRVNARLCPPSSQAKATNVRGVTVLDVLQAIVRECVPTFIQC
ncbi:hypothetical protein B0H13DRAFT_2356786 [Mycena leptocephala]|nr:hypothetical protein B0H13DRAFT_2356786 [Mycena leptocephala]